MEVGLTSEIQDEKSSTWNITSESTTATAVTLFRIEFNKDRTICQTANWKWRASFCRDEKTSDPIQSDGLSYLFHFDFDVERQCAVLTSKHSVQWPPQPCTSPRRRTACLPQHERPFTIPSFPMCALNNDICCAVGWVFFVDCNGYSAEKPRNVNEWLRGIFSKICMNISHSLYQ